jgi:hypothetical protein
MKTLNMLGLICTKLSTFGRMYTMQGEGDSHREIKYAVPVTVHTGCQNSSLQGERIG